MTGFNDNLKWHHAQIAPAGYGKTESIASLADHSDGRMLILTHTRAGVSALSSRLRAKSIPSRKYRIATIAGFCESWLSSYPWAGGFIEYTSGLKKKNTSDYYCNLYSKAQFLLSQNWAQDILQASYSGIIVDEYQDCTKSQHKLIATVSKNLPLRVFGDPMQGIFDWTKEELVDWNNLGMPISQMNSRPWRWINANSTLLGNLISNMRKALLPALQGASVRLELPPKSGFVGYVHPDDFRKCQFKRDANISSQLFLTKWPRNEYDFARRTIGFQSNEPIDSNELMAFSSRLEENTDLKLCQTLIDILETCFTGISTELKSFKKHLDNGDTDFSKIKKYRDLGELLCEVRAKKSPSSMLAVLKWAYDNKTFRLYRGILFKEISYALQQSMSEGCEITEALLQNRQRFTSYEEKYSYRRLASRPVLSKGLQYDEVIIDLRDKMDPREFYVSISRCTKKMIFITDSKVFTFNGIVKPSEYQMSTNPAPTI